MKKNNHSASNPIRKPLIHLRTLVISTFLLVLLNPVHAAGRNEQASRFYEDALVRFERKDIPGSIVQLKNALQQDPKMLAAHVLLGRAFLENGEPVQAELEFSKSIQLGVDRTEIVIPMAQAQFNQGKFRRLIDGMSLEGLTGTVRQGLLAIKSNALLELGDLKAARETLTQAYAAGVGKPAHLILIDANLSFREGNAAAAKGLVDQAIKLDPGNAPYWYLRATIAHSEGNVKAALADYDKAIALNAKYLMPRLGRVSLLLDVMQDKQADLDLQYLRKEFPEDPRVIYLSAVLAERRNDHAAATQELNAVTKVLDAAVPEVINQSSQLLLLGGLAHYSLNHTEQTKSYLQRLLSLAPNHVAGRKLLGMVLLRENRYDDAVDVLIPAFNATPNDAHVLSLLASAYMGQKEYRKASGLLERAVKIGGGAAKFESSLGFSLLGGGQEMEGIERLAQAFRKDTSQEDVGTALAMLYIKRGQPRQAVQIAEAMAKRSERNPRVLNLLGVTRVAANDRTGGRAAYEKAIALDARFMPARLNLAKLDAAEGKAESARNRLAEILKVQRNNTQAMIELASLEESLGHMDVAIQHLQKVNSLEPRNIPPGLHLAELYLRKGDAEKALNIAKGLEVVDGKDLGVLAMEGRAYAAVGKPGLAQVVYKRMTAYAGFDATSQYKIARLQLDLGDQAAAVYSLEKALSGTPDFLPAMVLMAEIEVKTGKLAEAEARGRRLVERYPNNEAGYRVLGNVASARGRHDEALLRYQAAYDKAPSTQTMIQLFQSYGRLGREAQAGKLMSDWLKAHPQDDDARLALAESYVRNGKLAAARAELEAIVKRRGDNAGIFNNLANILLQQGDKAALDYAEKAYRLKSNDAVVADTLGWVLVQQGQVEKGLGYLREAKLRDSTNAETRYHLAVALDKLGRKGEARQEVDQALAGKAEFPGVDDAKRLRQKLGGGANR